MTSLALLHSMARRLLPLAAAGAGLASAGPALAYVGPGAGIGTLGGILAVLGAVAVALLGLLLFPLHLIVMARRRNRSAQPQGETLPSANAD